MIRWFSSLGMHDVEEVGGKNASIGELIRHLARASVKVPNGFATTASAYREFLAQDSLGERIEERLQGLDVDDVAALAQAGADIRGMMAATALPIELAAGIRQAYKVLERDAGAAISVAVRSSATAEDLPEASFAGQQDTYLNVRGVDNVLEHVKKVFILLIQRFKP